MTGHLIDDYYRNDKSSHQTGSLQVIDSIRLLACGFICCGAEKGAAEKQCSKSREVSKEV